MNVYGEQLSYFPELFDDYDILSFDKQVPAGLVNEKVVFKDVRAYLTRNLGGKEEVVTSMRTENQLVSFYVEGDSIDRGMINQGLYVREKTELFTFVKDNGYSKEGDFHMYVLQLVSGNNDKQNPVSRVNLGKNEYQ